MESLAVHSVLPERDALAWWLMGTTVVAGGMLRGLTGFGAALLMAPLLSLLVSGRETVCLVTLLAALPIGQSLTPSVIRLADRPLLTPMTAAAFVGVPVGVWLIRALPAQLFGPVVGVAVIASAAALLGGASLAHRRSTGMSLGVGMLSGVLTGFGGVGGPPAILYVLGVEPDGHRARANFIVFFAFLYPLALGAIALAGMLSWSELAQGLLLAPLFHLGGVLGEGLYGRLGKRHFRPLVLALLMVAGAMASFPRGERQPPAEGEQRGGADREQPTVLVRGALAQCGTVMRKYPAIAARYAKISHKSEKYSDFLPLVPAGTPLA